MATERLAYRLCDVTVASALALPELRRARLGPGAWHIDVDGGPRGEYAWFHRWRAARRTWLSFARTPDGYLLRFPALADFAVSPGARRIVCRPRRGLPPATLRHLLLDQVMPLALSADRLVLHASAVHVPGFGAVAFIGPTGRGKSTLAAALARHGCELLTDDCLVLGERAGRVSVLPSYPGVRLWADAAAALGNPVRASVLAHYTRKRRLSEAPQLPFRSRPSPLRALFLLAPPGAVRDAADIRECPPRDRLMSLVACAYLLDVHDRAHLAAQFRRLARLVQRVPTLRLRVRRDRRQLSRTAHAVRVRMESVVAGPQSRVPHRASLV
jgi:hypothetical protein